MAVLWLGLTTLTMRAPELSCPKSHGVANKERKKRKKSNQGQEDGEISTPLLRYPKNDLAESIWCWAGGKGGGRKGR